MVVDVEVGGWDVRYDMVNMGGGFCRASGVVKRRGGEEEGW